MSLVLPATAQLKQTYRYTFETRRNNIKDVRHTLLVNPQSLSQNEPTRSSVTQTLGGVYITDFGAGLPTVVISGTTGYKKRYNSDGEQRDGYTEFMHFRNDIYRNFIESNDPSYTMYWYNWEDEEYWQIQPTSFKLQRSVSEPMLYRYEFAFTCIGLADMTGVVKTASSYIPGSEVNFASLNTLIKNSVENLKTVYGIIA
jgi:hypothetical protein